MLLTSSSCGWAASSLTECAELHAALGSILHMDLYGQDAELRLLSRCLPHLEHHTVIDVGAERGSLTAGLLAAGADRVDAIEPHPANAALLRTRFAEDGQVVVHECAVGGDEGRGDLRVSTSPTGEALPFGHTLLERTDGSEISWTNTVTVRVCSLESMARSGAIPKRVGILKIDTEGYDFAVVEGMGDLEADIIMVEHWTDLPNSLGTCPWTTEQIVGALRPRGFEHFAFIIHRGEFVTLKWDDGQVEQGAMGNLVFVHNRVQGPVMSEMLACGGELAEQTVSIGQGHVKTAADRLGIISELERAAEDRLTLANELRDAAEARLRALEEVTAALARSTAELDALRPAPPGPTVR